MAERWQSPPAADRESPLKERGSAWGVMTELPMVIINVQRGGPSTGLPTKTEQSDLFLSYFGRNGDCPMPVIAAQSPADCFEMAQEAMRIAVEHMTPVFLLTDGYIANGAEPWRIPQVEDLTPIVVTHPTESNANGEGFLPYLRNEKLVRPWAVPGTPGLEHRLGGLEKSGVGAVPETGTGNVSYDPANHNNMVRLRAEKIERIAEDIPSQEVHGPETGELLVVSWGGPYGAVRTAVNQLQRAGKSVAHAHLRYIHPFPKNLGDVLNSYQRVLVPELNTGQLRFILRGKFLVDAEGLNKIQGKPFLVSELVEKIESMLN